MGEISRPRPGASWRMGTRPILTKVKFFQETLENCFGIQKGEIVNFDYNFSLSGGFYVLYKCVIFLFVCFFVVPVLCVPGSTVRFRS